MSCGLALEIEYHLCRVLWSKSSEGSTQAYCVASFSGKAHCGAELSWDRCALLSVSDIKPFSAQAASRPPAQSPRHRCQNSLPQLLFRAHVLWPQSTRSRAEQMRRLAGEVSLGIAGPFLIQAVPTQFPCCAVSRWCGISDQITGFLPSQRRLALP